MKAQSIALSIDHTIQVILMVLLGLGVFAAFASGVTGILFIAMVLFPIGVWQVLSGIYFGIVRKDNTRAKYVLGSLLYVGVLILGTYFIGLGSSSKTVGITLGVIFYIIIPSIIAGWYFQYTQSDLEKVREELKTLVKVDASMENILDSEEIFKPKL